MTMDKTPTVFVVDDDQDVQQSLCTLAKSARLVIETYPDAESFLANYESGWPGCVLVDLQMAGMDGVKLAEVLKIRGEAIPVIIHTRQNGTETVVHAMQAGAYDYLEKPVPYHQLLTRIDHAIQEDRRRRQPYRMVNGVNPRTESVDAREHETPDWGAGRTIDVEDTAGSDSSDGSVGRYGGAGESESNKAVEVENQLHEVRANHDVNVQDSSLSPRLRETLKYLMRGDNEKQVAYRLKLSQYTIHDYVKALYKRFEVNSRAELLAKCWSLGNGQPVVAEGGKRQTRPT